MGFVSLGNESIIDQALCFYSSSHYLIMVICFIQVAYFFIFMPTYLIYTKLFLPYSVSNLTLYHTVLWTIHILYHTMHHIIPHVVSAYISFHTHLAHHTKHASYHIYFTYALYHTHVILLYFILCQIILYHKLFHPIISFHSILLFHSISYLTFPFHATIYCHLYCIMSFISSHVVSNHHVLSMLYLVYYI